MSSTMHTALVLITIFLSLRFGYLRGWAAGVHIGTQAGIEKVVEEFEKHFDIEIKYELTSSENKQ